MQEICPYKTPENYGNKNDNFEESEIDEGFDLTSYSGFNIKNCDMLIDSFQIKLSEEDNTHEEYFPLIFQKLFYILLYS